MTLYPVLKPSGIVWLGDIPAHWKVERLKDVCDDILSGGTPKTNVFEYWEGGDIIWLSPTDFQDFDNSNFIDNSRIKITKLGYADCSAKLLPIGTVIMTSRASIGLAKISSEILCTNQGFMNFICSSKLNNKFLLYIINSFLGYKFQNIATGTTFLEISRRTVKQEKITLPPIQEQTAITHYLDQATQQIDEALRLKKEQLAQLDTYRKALIHETVTKGLDKNAPLSKSGVEWLGDVPRHWKVMRLKDISDVVLGKMLCNEDKGNYELKPYLKSKNIGWNQLKLNDVEEMWFSQKEMDVLCVKKGDLLISEGGEVGKTSIWNDELEECYIQNSVHKVTFRNGHSSKYFLYYLNYMGSIDYFKTIVSQVSIAHLTREKLVLVKILVPKQIEQQAIVTFLDEKTQQIATAKANIEAQIASLETYRKSLIHECVTGKRRVL